MNKLRKDYEVGQRCKSQKITYQIYILILLMSSQSLAQLLLVYRYLKFIGAEVGLIQLASFECRNGGEDFASVIYQ